MIFVGEKINATRKQIAQAIEERDSATIVESAGAQKEAGADYIDVNAGIFVDSESEHLCWLVEAVQEAIDTPLCIDSPSPKAIEEALKRHKGKPMINSISLEKDRWDGLSPLLENHPAKVVALCMGADKMPITVEDRMTVARELVSRLMDLGLSVDDIYVDPLIQPISVDPTFGRIILSTIQGIMEEFPGIHTICGLSNISYGLPLRKKINRMFLVLAMGFGLDGAILDVQDKEMMADILTAEAILGEDDMCLDFLQAYREGKLQAT